MTAPVELFSDSLIEKVRRVLSRPAPNTELADIPHEAHALAVVDMLRKLAA